MLPADLFGKSSPFVIRHQPHLIIQSANPVPRIASKAEVSATMYAFNYSFVYNQIFRSERPPDIYPIVPTLDLKLVNIYNTAPVVPRSQFRNLHMNTLLLSKEQDQKYPFTR